MLSLPSRATSLMMLIISIQVSIATPNCNHAAIEGYIVVADVCNTDGADSHMLQCRDGQGYYKLFTSNDNCDENHNNIFEMSLNSVFENPEVVCDAEPCHIAVFENYDGGLTECTGHCGAGGDEMCDQEPELVWYCEDCSCKDLGDRADSSDSGDSTDSDSPNSSENACYDHCATCDGSGWEDCATCEDGYEMTGDDDQDGYGSCTLIAMRRLQDSSSSEWDNSNESSSSESSSCDYDATPSIYAFIIDACIAAGDSESIKIACTGTHDAMVGYFLNDENHECSGTATITVSADAFADDDCTSMVACNVEAGADDDEDDALTATVFAPLLIAFAVLINV